MFSPLSQSFTPFVTFKACGFVIAKSLENNNNDRDEISE